MCIIAISFKLHYRFPIVILSNRDEYFKRPTQSIAWWRDHPNILAGKDLLGGGTWFGLHRNGKFAAITNIREGVTIKSDAFLSRGNIVLDCLLSDLSIDNHLQTVARKSSQYKGFNLVVGDKNAMYFYSNKDNYIQKLVPGLYAFSNGSFDGSWPKVKKIKAAFTFIESIADVDREKLFLALNNDNVAPIDALPDTGVGKALELAYSSIFVKMPNYGTRNSSVVTYHNNNNVKFDSREFSSDYRCIDYSSFDFELIS